MRLIKDLMYVNAITILSMSIVVVLSVLIPAEEQVQQFMISLTSTLFVGSIIVSVFVIVEFIRLKLNW